MLFTSYEFIAFLAIFFLLYYLIPKKHQWKLVLLFSYIFYYVASPAYLIYILITTITVYFAALIPKCPSLWVTLSLAINVGILVFTKYSDFLFSGIDLSFLGLVMPMGISFYTLQAISYVLDVKRGTIEAEKNFFKVALFVSFFPQLVQGPISRFGDLSKTLYNEHEFDFKQFSFGLERILWGFFKKLVIADRLLPTINTIIGDVNNYNGAYAFLAMFLYIVDLYADFSGGIDITIGIAESAGITLKENFIRPFFSKSLKEYWRRWHITLSSWLKDYIYIPLGGSRCSKLRCSFNLLITFLVSGLWHGASWNFVIWGLLNGLILAISKEFQPLYNKFHNCTHFDSKKWYRGFEIIRTFLLVTCLHFFYCYDSVKDSLFAFESMVTAKNYGIFFDGTVFALGLTASDFIVVALAVLLIFAVSMIQRTGSVREKIAAKPFAFRAITWSLLFIVTVVFGAYGIGYDASQFIYNRF